MYVAVASRDRLELSPVGPGSIPGVGIHNNACTLICNNFVLVQYNMFVCWSFYVFIIKSIEIELIMLNVVLYGIFWIGR